MDDFRNSTVAAVLRAVLACAVSMTLAGCKGRTPPDPVSPPKPKMEQGAKAAQPLVWRSGA